MYTTIKFQPCYNTFLSLGKELPDPVERRRGLHLVLDPLLYPLVLIAHSRELTLFVLEALLHVVPVPPVLHESLDLRYGEHVVLEVRDYLEQLVLGMRIFTRRGLAVAGPTQTRRFAVVAMLIAGSLGFAVGRWSFRSRTLTDQLLG